jgi:hypothetical protein
VVVLLKVESMGANVRQQNSSEGGEPRGRGDGGAETHDGHIAPLSMSTQARLPSPELRSRNFLAWRFQGAFRGWCLGRGRSGSLLPTDIH